MSDEAHKFSPLTKEEIEAVIKASDHPESLEKILDVNFVGLDRPCSVSLGVDCCTGGANLTGTRTELIAEILKSHGIDAVDSSSPSAVDPSKYVLDKSGISLPFMEPSEALKATAELNDIFLQHGFQVTGYASPRTQESLCLSTKYSGRKINVLEELDDNPKAAEMLEKRGVTAKDFIQRQLEEALNLPEVDVQAMNNANLDANVGIKYLYRGGTMGDNSFAVQASRRSKDIVYTSPGMSTAVAYSTGLEAGFAPFEMADGKQVQYGNVYRFAATEDLNFWRNFGYEYGQEHVVGRDVYESPVFAHKNKVNGVFFVVKDAGDNRRVVQITDDNGKYISKEWEDFMALHTPRMRAGSEYGKQRNDNQIKGLKEGELFSWKVKPCEKILDLSGCDYLDLSGADLSQFEELKLPQNIESLEGTKLPKKLDISKCDSLKLTETDLARFDELTVGRCSNMDLSTFKGELKFSQNIEFMNTKLPQSIHSLDLRGKQAVIQNTDFGGMQELKLPEYLFSGDLDVTETEFMALCGGDKSQLAYISPDCKMDNLKKLDVQDCKNLDLRNWNLDKIEELKLPKDFDVSKLPEGIVERNPAVARAVKISHGEMVETLEPVQNAVKEKVDLPPEIKAEKTIQNAENSAADRIQQLRGVEHSGSTVVSEVGEKVIEKTAVHAGTEAVKSSEGIVSAIAKADNAVNQAIDKTIDKGSELLNNNAIGRAYEKVTEKAADTKVVKAVEKTTAKAVEKAANTVVGKAVTKTVAKAAGSAVGKSVIKKIPLVSAAAGCYFAWDRIKEGDWKGACGEVASGVAGCLPGLGTGISAAIDVGLAAKDIKTAIDENKQPVAESVANTGEEKTAMVEKTEEDKKKMRDIILQKQGRLQAEQHHPIQQQAAQQNNFNLQQRAVQQGRG